jgi:hypothetical protein
LKWWSWKYLGFNSDQSWIAFKWDCKPRRPNNSMNLLQNRNWFRNPDLMSWSSTRARTNGLWHFTLSHHEAANTKEVLPFAPVRRPICNGIRHSKNGRTKVTRERYFWVEAPEPDLAFESPCLILWWISMFQFSARTNHTFVSGKKR